VTTIPCDADKRHLVCGPGTKFECSSARCCALTSNKTVTCGGYDCPANRARVANAQAVVCPQGACNTALCCTTQGASTSCTRYQSPPTVRRGPNSVTVIKKWHAEMARGARDRIDVECWFLLPSVQELAPTPEPMARAAMARAGQAPTLAAGPLA
jgi:hypothetical protein